MRPETVAALQLCASLQPEPPNAPQCKQEQMPAVGACIVLACAMIHLAQSDGGPLSLGHLMQMTMIKAQVHALHDHLVASNLMPPIQDSSVEILVGREES